MNVHSAAIFQFYACDDAKDAFVSAFVAAWAKVMDLDRFDQRTQGKYAAPRRYSSPCPKL